MANPQQELKPHFISQQSIEEVNQISILDVASALGYNLKRAGKQYQIACPDPNHQESVSDNCYIEPQKNMFKCFSCDTGGNSAVSFYAIHENGSYDSKKDFMVYLKKTADLFGIQLYRNDGKPFNAVQEGKGYTPRHKFVPAKELDVRDAIELDRVYRAFLSLCPVRAHHFTEWTNKRGFSEEQINTMGLRSVPSNEEWVAILSTLTQHNISLERVPGFAQQFIPDFLEVPFPSNCLEAGEVKNKGEAQKGHWLYTPATFTKGYFIPVRNKEGYIVRLRIRKDEGSPKYIWFSSVHNVEQEQDMRHVRKNGVSSGAPVNISVPQQVLASWTPGDAIEDCFATDVVIATEGEIKSQIAANVFKALVAGLPGAGQFEKLTPLLKEWNVKKLIIAYDMDTLTREDDSLKAEKKQAILFNIVKSFALEMKRQNVQVYLWTWNMADGKGLDDLVLNRKLPVEINLATGQKRNVTFSNIRDL